MSVSFDVDDRMHDLIAKFVKNNLPEAKKPYNLKPEHQPVLNIHKLASKAAVYNIETDPETIEDGLNAGLKLMRYLIADGFIVDTPLFNLRVRVPGEYNGKETSLPDGVHPIARIRTKAKFREYIRDHVQISIDGVYSKNGYITEFLDIDENETNSVFVPGDQFKLTGVDIKAIGDNPSCGVFFVPVDNPAAEVRVMRIAENSRSKIIGICPQTGYQRNKIVIRTQYSGSNSVFLKTVRVLESDFVIEEA